MYLNSSVCTAKSRYIQKWFLNKFDAVITKGMGFVDYSEFHWGLYDFILNENLVTYTVEKHIRHY